MRKHLHSGTMLLMVFLHFSFLVINGCGLRSIESTWRDRKVTIDGIDNGPEWENARYFFEEEKITLGILNDENNIYLRISSRDRELQRKLIAFGMTIWFDEKGGKKKNLGIHFPLGIRDRGMDKSRKSNNEDQFRIILGESLSEIEIIDKAKDNAEILLLSDVNGLGIETLIGYDKNNLVYELKIPLLRTEAQPYGIGNDTGQAIGIGMLIGEIDPEQLRKNMQRGIGGGRGGIPGGDVIGGRGGINDNRGMDSRRGLGKRRYMDRMAAKTLDSLELWLKIHLKENGE
ncbi:hypothetical protein ACFL47_09610 [Candidatus Latescibacterota bacterium]